MLSRLFSLAAHAKGALAVTWSPDGSRFTTGGMDGLARVWDATTGQSLLTLIGHGDQVRDVSWSPEGRRIATASGDAGVVCERCLDLAKAALVFIKCRRAFHDPPLPHAGSCESHGE